MASPIGSNSSITFKNEILDGGKYSNEYHSTFRDGQYMLMFSAYYGRGKDVSVTDLESGRKINTYKFNLNEGILNFRFPYIVSRIDNNLIRIWDLSSSSNGPVNTIDAELAGIHRAVIYENNLIILSNQNESMLPNYMTLISDIEQPDKYEVTIPTKIEGVDFETGLLMHDGQLLLSMLYGAKIIVIPLFNKGEGKVIDCIENCKEYLQAFNGTSRQAYVNNIIQSFAAEGNTLVGATEKVIKVWDLTAGKLKQEFRTEKLHQLYTLEGRFLLSSCPKRIIHIWDIASGNLLCSMKNTSPHPIPHCVLYKDKIYHVNAKEEKIPDTIGLIPCTEQKSLELPTSQVKEKNESCNLM